ncbi:MAG: tRNA lysidine(34) synthetase TilS [Oceanospirillaceae bacterium]|nr:tRNA lysidine(34) synthetase TilS [Oceanospirillaceae bacterium]MBT4442214.1 tRNA lysidine(34) synthetase TilS [Oceanospirillaceae bacterium]MBT6076783.1 tRNA lysidine(34) synthetase TilS [Oceanospirillaceae bacterium]
MSSAVAFTHHVLTTETCGLNKHVQAAGWLVAVSGGLDSMVLLHALVQLGQSQQCPPIRVVHVNHGLHTDAQAWQQQVEQQAREYGLSCATQTVVIDPIVKQNLGLEAAARDARYQFFEQQLQAGEVLLLAQHADDQSETMLLRLMRGAGVTGLSAMPKQRSLGLGCMLRPLINVRQQALADYARQHHVVWSDDPSNDDARFDRNFLRHQVLPLLRQRWPAMDRCWATTAAVMGDTTQLLNEVAAEDLVLISSGLVNSQCLRTAALLALSKPRRHNLLRHWLSLHKVPALSYVTMQQIDGEVLASADDAQPCLVFGAWCLRRSHGQLWLTPYAGHGKGLFCEPWSATISQAELDHGSMVLSAGRLDAGEYAVAMSLAVGDHLELRGRVGGERCKPLGRTHSQNLKKLLQEAKIPTWERSHLPLFYINGELAMVADLWVNAGFEPAFGEPAWGWQKPS